MLPLECTLEILTPDCPCILPVSKRLHVINDSIFDTTSERHRGAHEVHLASVSSLVASLVRFFFCLL